MNMAADHRKLFAQKPVQPKQCVNRIISMKNESKQIYINGLTDHITETVLIDYFNQHAPVIACRIFPNDNKYAIIEFNNENSVKKILDVPAVRLKGAHLSLGRIPRQLVRLLSSNNDNETTDTDNKMQVFPIDEERRRSAPAFRLDPLPVQNQSSSLLLPSIRQNNLPSQQSVTLLNSTTSSTIMESVLIPSNSNDQSGWSSPPRSITKHCPSIDSPSRHSSPTPSRITSHVTTSPLHRSTLIDPDPTSITQPPSNNILHFVEDFQNELDQIKDEYRLKFAENRTHIEQDIDRLIDEERHAFEKLARYLTDRGKRVEKRKDNKRKYDPSSATH